MTKTSDISLEIRGEREEIAVIRLTRPAKRNALNDGLILALRDVMDNLPASDADLPNTGVATVLEHALSSPFVRMPERGYGTRSSLLVRTLAHSHQPARWQGKYLSVELDPAIRPFAIWRLDAGNR